MAGDIILKKNTSPETPSTPDKVNLYVDNSDGKLKVTDSAGDSEIIASEATVDTKISSAIGLLNNYLFEVVAGTDYAMISSTTETSTASATYTLLRSFTVGEIKQFDDTPAYSPYDLNLTFDTRCSDNATHFFDVRVNDISVYEFNGNSDNWAARAKELVGLSAGDSIKIYGKHGAATRTVYLRNVYLKFSLKSIGDYLGTIL